MCGVPCTRAVHTGGMPCGGVHCRAPARPRFDHLAQKPRNKSHKKKKKDSSNQKQRGQQASRGI
eukprot:354646-Chlamydomonas_euryale.AAC.2